MAGIAIQISLAHALAANKCFRRASASDAAVIEQIATVGDAQVLFGVLLSQKNTDADMAEVFTGQVSAAEILWRTSL